MFIFCKFTSSPMFVTYLYVLVFKVHYIILFLWAFYFINSGDLQNKILIVCKISTEITELWSCWSTVITNMELAILKLIWRWAGICTGTQRRGSSAQISRSQGGWLFSHSRLVPSLCNVNRIESLRVDHTQRVQRVVSGELSDFLIREVGQCDVRYNKYSTMDL